MFCENVARFRVKGQSYDACISCPGFNQHNQNQIPYLNAIVHIDSFTIHCRSFEKDFSLTLEERLKRFSLKTDLTKGVAQVFLTDGVGVEGWMSTEGCFSASVFNEKVKNTITLTNFKPLNFALETDIKAGMFQIAGKLAFNGWAFQRFKGNARLYLRSCSMRATGDYDRKKLNGNAIVAYSFGNSRVKVACDLDRHVGAKWIYLMDNFKIGFGGGLSLDFPKEPYFSISCTVYP